MAIMGLNLPTDIPWEQICVTQDMMAADACEPHHPPKWRSSIAVARYIPDEEYQAYPNRKITYLKVTCTITGYQPRDKEVEGRVNFSGVSVQTIANIDSLLESYLPCSGALIQVAISPSSGLVPRDEYPYFMDFQPKKRELYEMVTDTGERSSRSLEDTRIGKASGTSHSAEVLDVDQGGSSGGSANANVSYAGFGAGVGGSWSDSHQGQWGTKQMGAQESSVARSTDESREKRESVSHTTQLSQMYHLLDSYHQGTNRALFFVQPRPHILELPTGFVRGPRGIEGIQEFFLVVNQAKDQDGFEVSVRLDTSHLTVIPIMDYDRTRTDTVFCKAGADIPSDQDTPAAPEQNALRDGDGDRVGTIYYNCFKREDHQSCPYNPPSGYKIDVDTNGGYLDMVNVGSHGSSSVDVDPGGASLTVHCDAVSHVCKYEDHDITVGYWAPDNVEADSYKWTAYAQRDVLVYLISREPVKKIGDRHVLLITTRELCCGGSQRLTQGVADVIGLTGRDGKSLALTPVKYASVKRGERPATREERPDTPFMTHAMGQNVNSGEHCNTAPGMQHDGKWNAADMARKMAETLAAARLAAEPPMMTAREANELTSTIREAMIQSAGSRKRDGAEPIPYIETDLFHQQLHREMLQTPAGREMLSRPVMDVAGPDIANRLARRFKRSADQVDCARVVAQSVEDLAQILDIAEPDARRLKLACLGIPMHAAYERQSE